jgi:arginine/serine-rich splicing factor 16
MWHQQRKEEKRIKGLMVDKRRRAERRRNYYEQIKMDPNQFLQVPYRIYTK